MIRYTLGPLIRAILFTLGLGLLTQTALAAPSLSDYGLLPEIQKMALSPDGKMIVFRRVTADTDILMLISLADSKTLAMINVEDVKPQNIEFLNNDTVLLQASDVKRIAGFKGKIEVSTGYAWNFRKKKIRQLLKPGDGTVYPGQTGLGDVAGVSPDQKYAYMPAFLGTLHLLNGSPESPPFGLVKAPIDHGGRVTIHASGDSATRDFFVDAAGEVLAREDYDDTSDLHRILVKNGKSWDEIYREKTDVPTKSFVGLTPDRKSLVFLDEDQNGRTVCYSMALSDGKITGPLYEREDADVDWTIKDRQRTVFGVAYSGFSPSYKFSDPSLDAKIKNVVDSFPGHSVWLVDWTPDWKNILVEVEGSQAVGDYYLYSDGKPVKFLASNRSNIKPGDINPIGKVTFKARDGLAIPTLLTIPKSDVANMKNLPAIIMPHGGPASHDTIGFDFLAQALAEQGYLVIMPQFRGSDGFGAEFENAGHGEWGKKMQDDLSDAVKFFYDKKMIDPKRVCIVGGSYGGYAALAGGAFTPTLYKCVVSIAGVSDLNSFEHWVSEERGKSSASVSYWKRQIGGGDYSRIGAKAMSPVNSADLFQAATLLLHGRNDNVVPYSQSQEMYKALKRAHKKVEFVELKGEDHHLSFGETRLATLEAIVKFVNDNIGPVKQ